MNAYRRSPGYSTIDQNKASQFMQNDGSGRTFISADEASNSQLPYFMQFMGGNANGNMNTGIGTSNATTGLNFANLPTGPTGATGPQGVTGPAGTSTKESQSGTPHRRQGRNTGCNTPNPGDRHCVQARSHHKLLPNSPQYQ